MRVVIVGAGYAGLSSALRLSRIAPSAQVTLINASSRFVERIRLHEHAAGAQAPTHDLSAMLRGTSVDLRVGIAEAIDLERRRLRIGSEEIHWDRLVLALGSRVDLDGVEGAHEHAFTLDAASTAWLANVVPTVAARCGRAVVVGGGLTGIEAAAELAEAFPRLSVCLVTRSELAAEFAPSARSYARTTLERLGVRIQEGVRVRAVRAHALETEGAPIAFDVCIWAAGFRAPALAEALGLETNGRGQILVDATLRVPSRPEVYVAGDLAALKEPLGDPLPMGCKSAFPTGLHVAENVARSLRGERPRRFAYRAVFFCVSLGRRDGLIQSPSADTRAATKVFTGRGAARFKELVCRGTRWVLALERRRAALSRALRLARVPALPRAPSPGAST